MFKSENLFKKLFFRISKLFLINYTNLLERLIQDCDTVIDLGCGYDSKLGKIKKRKKFSLGVDIFEKYIEISKKKKIHDKYLLLNILDIDKKISQKSFDCVMLLEVIEHLEKIDGIKLIKKMERIARKKIIISTPNGYIHQSKYDYNIYQIHKSGWELKLFRKLNFKIYGVRGLKYIKGERNNIKYKPIKFWNLISIISNLFVIKFPQFAYQLICVKKL